LAPAQRRGLALAVLGFEGRAVTIRRLLQNSVLGPDEIARMSIAYEQALKNLGLVDRTDPVTELVARKIIDIARTGETDPARISALAIEALGAHTEE
jgi:hypothetical protein